MKIRYFLLGNLLGAIFVYVLADIPILTPLFQGPCIIAEAVSAAPARVMLSWAGRSGSQTYIKYQRCTGPAHALLSWADRSESLSYIKYNNKFIKIATLS